MARAISTTELMKSQNRAGNSYQAQVVFEARLLELNPRDKSAAKSILELLPTNEAQQLALTTFGDSICDTESVRDMGSLDRLEARLPRAFATAVLLVPAQMSAYISFAYESADDPHSDYGIQMQRVCKVNHAAFISAVKKLGDGSPENEGHLAVPSTQWFIARIFNSKTCRTLVLPEAE
jgi:hypothetical protein